MDSMGYSVLSQDARNFGECQETPPEINRTLLNLHSGGVCQSRQTPLFSGKTGEFA